MRWLGVVVALCVICGCGEGDKQTSSAPKVVAQSKMENGVTNVSTLAANSEKEQKSQATNTTANAKSSKERPVIKPEDVVLIVNGLKVTKAEVDKNFDMFLALWENRNNRQLTNNLEKVKLMRGMRKKFAPLIFKRLVAQTKLGDKQISPELEAKIRSVLTKKYSKTFCRKGQKFDQMKSVITSRGFGDLFNAEFEFDVRLQAVMQTTYSNEFVVTAAELEKCYQDVAAYNKMAAATNALNEKLGKELVARARSGKEDFLAISKQYSQDPEDDSIGVKINYSEVDFQDDMHPVWEKVVNLKDGEVSDLFHTAQGFEIYKMYKHISKNESNSMEDEVEVGKIFLRKAYEFPKQSDEDFESDILAEKRDAFLHKYMRDLIKSSKIEMPFGNYGLR